MKLNNKKVKKAKRIFSIIIGILLLVSIYINTYLIIKYNVLPTKYLIVYGIFIVLVPIIFIFFTIFRRPKRFMKYFISYYYY